MLSLLHNELELMLIDKIEGWFTNHALDHSHGIPPT